MNLWEILDLQGDRLRTGEGRLTLSEETKDRLKTVGILLIYLIGFTALVVIPVGCCFAFSRVDHDYLFPVERKYFEKMGIPRSTRNPHEIKDLLGEPISTSIEANEFGRNAMYIVYELYTFRFIGYINITGKEEFWLLDVSIFDPDYRIGRRQLGIGSTRDEVSNVFERNGNRRAPLEGFGYVDDGLSIIFRLDDYDKVEYVVISFEQ